MLSPNHLQFAPGSLHVQKLLRSSLSPLRSQFASMTSEGLAMKALVSLGKCRWCQRGALAWLVDTQLCPIIWVLVLALVALLVYKVHPRLGLICLLSISRGETSSFTWGYNVPTSFVLRFPAFCMRLDKRFLHLLWYWYWGSNLLPPFLQKQITFKC